MAIYNEVDRIFTVQLLHHNQWGFFYKNAIVIVFPLHNIVDITNVTYHHILSCSVHVTDNDILDTTGQHSQNSMQNMR